MDDERAAEARRFGERVRAVREARGWSVRQLAGRMGIAGVRNWLPPLEAGRAGLPEAWVGALARALRLPPDEVAAGCRAGRILAYHRRRESAPVDTSEGPWTHADSLSRCAELLMECHAELVRVPSLADAVVPFARFGRPFDPGVPPLTLAELVGDWVSGRHARRDPDDDGVRWLAIARDSGMFNSGPETGFFPGRWVCRAWDSGSDAAIERARVKGLATAQPALQSRVPAPTLQDFGRMAARAASEFGRSPWTLDRIFGPEGLGAPPEQAVAEGASPTDDGSAHVSTPPAPRM